MRPEKSGGRFYLAFFEWIEPKIGPFVTLAEAREFQGKMSKPKCYRTQQGIGGHDPRVWRPDEWPDPSGDFDEEEAFHGFGATEAQRRVG